MKGWRAALACAMALTCASPAQAAPPFSVRSGLFPAAPTLPAGSRNDNTEPGVAVDGGGAFYADGNINGFTGIHDPRGAGESGADIWRSVDHGRTYRWIASPFNPGGNAPGVGGLDSDIAAARYRNAHGHYNVYAVTTALASTALAVCVDGTGCGLNDTRALLDLTATAVDPLTGIASSVHNVDPDANFFTVAAAYTTTSELRKPKRAPRKHRRPPPRRHHDDR